MARRANRAVSPREVTDPMRGRLLYTETLSKGLQPSKWTSGERRFYVDAVVRSLEAGLIVSEALLLTTQDMTAIKNVATAVLVAAGIGALFYMTDIRGPEARRESTPIQIYENGVQIYGSWLERKRGRYGFIPRERIDRAEVLTRKILVEGQVIDVPSRLRLFLSNGRTITTSRRIPKEVEAMARALGKDLGITVERIKE